MILFAAMVAAVLFGAVAVWRRGTALLGSVADALGLEASRLSARGEIDGHPFLLRPRLRPDRGAMALVGVPIGWVVTVYVAYLVLNVVAPFLGNVLGATLAVMVILAITVGAFALFLGSTVAMRLTAEGNFGIRAAPSPSKELRVDQEEERLSITYRARSRSLTGVPELDTDIAVEGPDLRVMSRSVHGRELAAGVKSGVRIEPGHAWVEWTPLLSVHEARTRSLRFRALVTALLERVDDVEVVFGLSQRDPRPEVRLRAAAALLSERPQHRYTRQLSAEPDPVAALPLGGLDALVALHTLRRNGRPRHIDAIEAVSLEGVLAMAASNTIAAIRARQGDSVGQLTEASETAMGGLTEATDHAGAISSCEADAAGSSPTPTSESRR